MNYIQAAKEVLRLKIDVEEGLLDLYTLLVFTRGETTTLEDVHDAWAIWRNNSKPDHKSLIPFSELTLEVQYLDVEYARAIQETSFELKNPIFLQEKRATKVAR